MIKNNINKIIKKKKFKWQEYHQKSSLKKNDLKFKKIRKNYIIFPIYKSYPRLNKFILPKPKLPFFDFKKALKKRSSFRKFSNKKISKEKISSLIYHSCGIINFNDLLISRRYYPSAGALYPIETYIIILNAHFPKGIYHYHVKKNYFEQIIKNDNLNLKNYFPQEFVYRSSFIIILTADIKRSMQKYGERAYRYSLIEAGHIGQNILLISVLLNIKSCPIGAFYDYELKKLLDLQDQEEILYCFAIGN